LSLSGWIVVRAATGDEPPCEPVAQLHALVLSVRAGRLADCVHRAGQRAALRPPESAARVAAGAARRVSRGRDGHAAPPHCLRRHLRPRVHPNLRRAFQGETVRASLGNRGLFWREKRFCKYF
jgi:hypothetical protein